METIDLKFRNLDIGYYFIYNDKAYVKVNDHSAMVLFSYLETPLFSNVNSVYNSMDENGNYTQPSHIKISFDAEEIIKFVKREDIKQFLVTEFLNSGRKYIKFSEVSIGDYFYVKSENTFYKKVSYSYAMPILKSKIGLDDLERIVITIIASATNTTEEYNALYYNGKKLASLNEKAINVITFSSNFKSFEVKSFDLSLNWFEDSKAFLRYISNIEDETLTFICNNNDIENISDIKNKKYNMGHISMIYEENEDASKILTSVGLTKNTIDNISNQDTLVVSSLKNKELLYLNKINADNQKYDFYNNKSKNYLEYTYSYETSQKQYVPSTKKEINLDEEVTVVSFYEITSKMLFDLSDNDIRSYCDYDLFNI